MKNNNFIYDWFSLVPFAGLILIITGLLLSVFHGNTCKKYKNKDIGIQFTYCGNWVTAKSEKGKASFNLSWINKNDVELWVEKFILYSFNYKVAHQYYNERIFSGYKPLNSSEKKKGIITFFQQDFIFQKIINEDKILLYGRQILIPEQESLIAITFTAPEIDYKNYLIFFDNLTETIQPVSEIGYK